MFICDCMYFQDESGQCICLICKGDVYACECTMKHKDDCLTESFIKEEECNG